MTVYKLKMVYEHHQNTIIKYNVQQVVVNGYYYILILKKLQVRIIFKEFLHSLFF
jgi:hypothetical protein